MADMVPLHIQVPEDMLEGFKKYVYSKMYSEHPDFKPIYNIINENASLTIGQLQYLLRQKGYPMSKAGVQKIANWCDLAYAK